MTRNGAQEDMVRCFLVGCPRSGTTLLQAMLASHSAVYSLPETHFFVKIRGRFHYRPRPLIVSPRAAWFTLLRVKELVGEPAGASPRSPLLWPFIGPHARAFWHLLDAAALREGKRAWVEKSPPHLHHLSTIQRFVPAARLVHIVREGRDVVASLYHLCLTAPENWIPQLMPGASLENLTDDERHSLILQAAIDRWNADITISLDHVDRPGHTHILYDDLITDPVNHLSLLCRFLGLQFEDDMLRYWNTAEQVVGWRVVYPHMQQAFRPLDKTRLRKFNSVLTEPQREMVTALLIAHGDPRAAIETRRHELDHAR